MLGRMSLRDLRRRGRGIPVLLRITRVSCERRNRIGGSEENTTVLKGA
jgi:hypothetical protein